MSCLDDLIGVYGLAEYSTTKSGLYINDLPGMTLAQLNKIKDSVEDYEDPGNVWEAIVTRGQNLFKADIRNNMRKYFRNKVLVDSSITARVEGNDILSTNSSLAGYWFDFSSRSRHLELHLNYVRFKLSASAQPTVYIYNASTGELITQFEATEEGTDVKIDLLYDLPTHEFRKIFVCYDDNISPYKVSHIDYPMFPNYGYGRIPSASDKILNNMRAVDLGMSLSFQVRCSIENFVCQNIDLLIEAYWYKLGVEWMNERIYSDRVNRYTLIDLPKARELKLYYETEYKRLLDDVLNDIQVEDDQYCFECSRMFNRRIALP